MNHTSETIDPRSDGALVGEITGDPALVLRSSTSNKRRVEDKTVLGGVALSLQSSAIKKL